MSHRPPFARLLLAAVSVSAVLLVVSAVLSVAARLSSYSPWLEAFDVNRETNVPTVWNAALLLWAAGAFLVVATLRPRGAWGWCAGGLVLIVMAFDEVMRLHERLRGLGSRAADLTGASLPTYSWVLPGAVVGLGLIVAAVVWARSCPPDVARIVVLAVLLYFTGALGVEGVSGWVERGWGVGWRYILVTTVEEGLEMIGCLLAMLAAARMLRTDPTGGLRLRAPQVDVS